MDDDPDQRTDASPAKPGSGKLMAVSLLSTGLLLTLVWVGTLLWLLLRLV